MKAKEIVINDKAVKKITLGDAVLWENAPKLPDGLVLWYDVERQEYTNADFKVNPFLIDFSGNGLDMQLRNFKFDGINDGVFNGGLLMTGKAHGYLSNLPLLSDLTIIAKRIFVENFGNFCSFLSNSPAPRTGWIFEINDIRELTGNIAQMSCSVPDSFFTSLEFPRKVSWATKYSYSGDSSNRIETTTYLANSNLWLGCLRGDGDYHINNVFYKLMIFNHSLTETEIQEIINTYFL